MTSEPKAYDCLSSYHPVDFSSNNRRSVFTFSLSLGDYLAARFTGGATQMIGSIIAANINLNPPVAAAYSMVPIFFIVIYLMVARRTGSLERM